jgi:hypothetical protein
MIIMKELQCILLINGTYEKLFWKTNKTIEKWERIREQKFNTRVLIYMKTLLQTQLNEN